MRNSFYNSIIAITYCTSNYITWYTGGRDRAVGRDSLLEGRSEENPDGGENLRAVSDAHLASCTMGTGFLGG